MNATNKHQHYGDIDVGLISVSSRVNDIDRRTAAELIDVTEPSKCQASIGGGALGSRALWVLCQLTWCIVWAAVYRGGGGGSLATASLFSGRQAGLQVFTVMVTALIIGQ